MRSVTRPILVKRAVALLMFAIAAAPASIAALTPDDALRAFDMFMHETDENGQHTDVNCDGVITPGDARSLYRRYLLDLPTPPCAPDTAIDSPATLVLRHRIEPGVAGHPTVYEVTIEVPAPGAVTAFGVRLRYPTEQLRLVDAGPGVDTEQWIAAGAVERSPGVIVAGGFDVDAAADAGPLQLVRLVFEADAAVDGRRFEVLETTDDIAGARWQNVTLLPSASGDVPDRFRLHGVDQDSTRRAFRFDIPVAARGGTRTRLTIYDSSGDVARVIFDGVCAPGTHAIHWDGTLPGGRAAAPGVYYARLQVRLGAQDLVGSQRVVIQ